MKKSNEDNVALGVKMKGKAKRDLSKLGYCTLWQIWSLCE